MDIYKFQRYHFLEEGISEELVSATEERQPYPVGKAVHSSFVL